MARTSALTELLYQTEQRLNTISPEKFQVVMFKGELSDSAKQFILDKVAGDLATINITQGFLPPMRLKQIYRDEGCGVWIHDRSRLRVDEIYWN